ncbi:response regulator [Paraburkholderia dinghuensis]|uniref:Response regulator n=1 Tax=Paraburkholderia dinghuensis TaxID=2305225 RepID=A0A3N6NVR4_9BURK|nr:response regulator [Paraburkholderia dinghuensis]RQH04663.1 response regulator [Paraburkholderia dinghuensis]
MSPHVLIVDDDPVVRDFLSSFFRDNGFKASVLIDGMHLDQMLERERPSVVVLDVMMPRADGLRALAALRAKGDDTPVIFASARGEVGDRIAGLTLGADDYVAKPFDPQELLLRIQTVLRRRGVVSAGASEARGCYCFGPFQLDFDARQLMRDGVRVPLRGGEFALLRIFARHPYRVLSRVLIHDLLQADGLECHERSIDVPIWRLRRVIEDNPSQPRFVQTVRGKGYVFVPQHEDGAEGQVAGNVLSAG